MSYTVDLLDGLARLLDTAGVGTYRPDGVYAAGETAITIAATPPCPTGSSACPRTRSRSPRP